MIKGKTRPRFHFYPVQTIILALALKFHTSASFRAIGKIITITCLYLEINTKAPSHSTVLTWVKKLGLYHIERPKEKADDWIIMLDESVEFGDGKLLVVFGIREKDVDFTRPLQYGDLVCLAEKVSPSWKGGDIKKVLDGIRENTGNIKYAVADMGKAITKALGLAGIKHVEDLTHKLSWIIKQLYEKDGRFIGYTKKLAHLRSSLCLGKISYMSPPAQRVQSRFMNLKPIVDWGVAVIAALKGKDGLAEERGKLGCIIEYEDIVNELDQVVQMSVSIQGVIKNNGLTEQTLAMCEKLLPKNGASGKVGKFRDDVLSYLSGTMETQDGGKFTKLLCTSDILESSFGKYKGFISSNLSMGITDLSLSIAAFTSDFENQEEIIAAMEKEKVNKIKEWREENIGKSLLQRRKEVLGRKGTKKKNKI